MGEYLALSGGPSLILCTAPRFELAVQSLNENLRLQQKQVRQTRPFHAESPAGRLTRKLAPFGSEYQFTFRDPHGGLGGLGASTAQFALLWAASRFFSSENPNLSQFGSGDWKDLLDLYRECSWTGEGHPPSGADLVAQLSGHLVEWDARIGHACSSTWPFDDLSFTLVRTGNKVATHEHLQQKKEIKEEILRPLVLEAKTAFQQGQSEKLCRAVAEYGRELTAFGLVSPETSRILGDLKLANQGLDLGVRAAKGCGAMGADVIAVLHKVGPGAGSAMNQRLQSWLQAQGLHVCGARESLSPGLQCVES